LKGAEKEGKDLEFKYVPESPAVGSFDFFHIEREPRTPKGLCAQIDSLKFFISPDSDFGKSQPIGL
jgi:hypothetical protein